MGASTFQERWEYTGNSDDADRKRFLDIYVSRDGTVYHNVRQWVDLSFDPVDDRTGKFQTVKVDGKKNPHCQFIKRKGELREPWKNKRNTQEKQETPINQSQWKIWAKMFENKKGNWRLVATKKGHERAKRVRQVKA